MMMFHKILCPTDFSEPSYCALRKAMEMAASCEADLYLLHVVPRDELAPGDADFAEVRRHLKDLIVTYAPIGLHVRAIVREGDVTREILRTVSEKDIDLIVMATHGMTGWREFALGSVMDEVVRVAPCPVFTISNAAHQRADIHGTSAVCALQGDDNATY